MIIGIGVDTVDIPRLERQLARTPALRDRLFARAERALGVPSLAARFAAKEALIKALGGSEGLVWQDLAVVRNGDRAPSFAPTPGLRAALAARGAGRVHLSMTHDAGIATAFVVLESAAHAGDPQRAAADPRAAAAGSGAGAGEPGTLASAGADENGTGLE